MKKVLGVLFLVMGTLVLMTSCCNKSLELPTSNVYVSQKILESSGAVVISSPFGQLSVGSATFAKTSLGNVVITAQHVVDLEMTIPYEIKVCSFLDLNDCVDLGNNYIFDRSDDVASDWAILKIDKLPKRVKPAKISKRLPRVGEEIIISGIPQGLVPWVSYGHVAYSYNNKEQSFFGVDGFAFFGSSGGGVYDSSGRLIGITSSIGGSEWGPQENKVLTTPIMNISIL